MFGWLAKKVAARIGEERYAFHQEIGKPGFPEEPPQMRFAVRDAINGRFIEVASFVTSQRGSEWITEYYIVPEGKKLSEALSMLMLLKGADK